MAATTMRSTTAAMGASATPMGTAPIVRFAAVVGTAPGVRSAAVIGASAMEPPSASAAWLVAPARRGGLEP